PITGTRAAAAFTADQCGCGCVSGTPGDRISAATLLQSMLRRSSVAKPASAACAILAALSSNAMTVAPPAFSAWQVASPEPPRPNTATVLPAKVVTGIITAASATQDRRAPGSPR